jgi:FlgD Ig-like domain
VTRRLPTVLVVLLIVATAGAFGRTELLKLETNPVSGPRVDKEFSPVCRCASGLAHISFRLRRADHVSLSIVDSHGHTVASVVRGESLRAGRVAFTWNGRDSRGNIVGEGSYRPKLELRRHGRTIVLPDAIRVDTTSPTLRIVRALPTTISPDGDGRRDGIHIHYTVSEHAKAILLVDGVQRVVTHFRPLSGVVSWYGRNKRKALPPGTHRLQLEAVDPAGNRTIAKRTITVRIRFIELWRTRIAVRRGARFGMRYTSDATSVHWHFAGTSGVARHGKIVLRAPKRRGTFALVVSERGHAVRAAVYVGRRSG